MAFYYHMSGGYHGNSQAWMLTSLALRMAQSVGSYVILSFQAFLTFIQAGLRKSLSVVFGRVAQMGLQTVTVIDGASSLLKRNEEGDYGGK